LLKVVLTVALLLGNLGVMAGNKAEAAAGWQSLDTQGDISATGVDEVRFTASPDGILFVVYNTPQRNGLTVKKYNGSSWELVGQAGFSNNSSNKTLAPRNPTIKISPQGVPYVAFFNNNASPQKWVMKYVGISDDVPTGWEYVGENGVSSGTQYSVPNSVLTYTFALDIAADGTPYFFYAHDSSTVRGAVKRYVDGQWELVGSSNLIDGDFPSGVTPPQWISDLDIQLHENTAYVAFINRNAGPYADKASVMKYGNINQAGGQWEFVGSSVNINKDPQNTTYSYLSKANTLDLTVSGDGAPYIAFEENIFINDELRNADYGASVLKYNGTDWVNLGAPLFTDYRIRSTPSPSFSTASPAHKPVLAVAEDGAVYLVYQEGGINESSKNEDGYYSGRTWSTTSNPYYEGITMLKQDGSASGTWEVVGERGFSGTGIGGRAYYLSMQMVDGRPYVVYQSGAANNANSSSVGYTVTAQKSFVTASGQRNTVSLSAPSVTAGDEVVLTAAGDRQNAAGEVSGDERYVPAGWTSTEAGQAGNFTVTGTVYTSPYVPATAGTYTVSVTFQKQVWNGSGWVNAAGATDIKAAGLTVNAVPVPALAQASGNSVSLSAPSVTAGNEVVLTAAGDRQNAAGTLSGDERYVPAGWTSTEAGQAGGFTATGPVYTTPYVPATAGTYTVSVIFQKQIWDGSSWADAVGATDIKTASLQVAPIAGGGGDGGGGPTDPEPQIPSAPQLHAAPGNAKVSLSWEPVAGAVGYRIYQSVSATVYGTEAASVQGSEHTYEVSGLVNGTTYYFTIQAIGEFGESALSGTVSATPITVPAAPVNLLATAGNGSVTVSFAPPENNGGSIITGYEVTSSPGGYTATGSGSPIIVSGLTNGTSYTFTVKAINAAGSSEPSVPSNSTVPQAPLPGGGGGGGGGGLSGDTVVDSLLEQNGKLQELLKQAGAADGDKASAAQVILKDIAASASSVVNVEEAEEAMDSIAQSLGSIGELLASMKDSAAKSKLVAEVANVVKQAASIIQLAESSNAAVDMASLLITEAAPMIKQTPDGSAASENLENALLAAGQAAVQKSGRWSPPADSVKVDGTTLTVTANKLQLSEQIKQAKNASAQLSKNLAGVLEESNLEALKPVLAVVIPRQEGVTAVRTDIPLAIFREAQLNQFSNVTTDFGYASFALPTQAFGAAKEGNTVSLVAELLEQSPEGTAGKANPITGSPVLQFAAELDGVEVERLLMPVKVSIDLSALDLSRYSTTELEKLTVYVLDEAASEWMPVGGKYERAAQSISVPRSHFSTYTVMRASGGFEDITSSNWGKKEVEYLLHKGVIAPTAQFSPEQEVTRAEFASWLVRATGLEAGGLSHPFADVTADSVYRKDIAAAYAAGLINGMSDTEFAPEAAISREEIATMLARALSQYHGLKAKQVPGNAAGAFADGDSISAWAVEGVALTTFSKLFDGYEDGTFRPEQKTTKQEAAALIYRMYQRQ
jgi:hypothetical protein